MSDRENTYIGKCCYLEGGERCTCQCYRVNTQDEYLCDVCFHDIGYHERQYRETIVSTTSTPNISTSRSSSILNQVLTGQALEEQSIANELSQTFSHRNPSIRPRRNQRNFDPVSGLTNYNAIHGSRNRRRGEIIRESLIQVILLPDFGHELQSPLLTQDK